jgi:hypothetical protein
MSRINRFAERIAAGLIWALILIGTAAGPVAAQNAPARLIGRQVNSLQVSTIDGKPTDLCAQKGWKVIYFFSSACKCVSRCERLSFIPLAMQYSGRVSFYAVDANWFDLDDHGRSIQAAVRLRGLPYPIFLDRNHKAVDSLGAVATPQTFILDPGNHIVFVGMPDDSTEYSQRTGQDGFTKAYLADALAQALSGQKIAQPTTKSFGCAICPTPP